MIDLLDHSRCVYWLLGRRDHLPVSTHAAVAAQSVSTQFPCTVCPSTCLSQTMRKLGALVRSESRTSGCVISTVWEQHAPRLHEQCRYYRLSKHYSRLWQRSLRRRTGIIIRGAPNERAQDDVPLQSSGVASVTPKEMIVSAVTCILGLTPNRFSGPATTVRGRKWPKNSQRKTSDSAIRRITQSVMVAASTSGREGPGLVRLVGGRWGFFFSTIRGAGPDRCSKACICVHREPGCFWGFPGENQGGRRSVRAVRYERRGGPSPLETISGCGFEGDADGRCDRFLGDQRFSQR
nr:hypothetical protein CFP56_24371 [Quercus suber]